MSENEKAGDALRTRVARIRATVRSRGRRFAVEHLGLPHAEGTRDAPDSVVAGEVTRLWLRATFSRERVIDERGEAVVVMTTHGERIQNAWLALESIGRGDAKPGRLILFLEHPIERLPWRLRRLARRGVEIRAVKPGLGVYTKFWRYIESGDNALDRPLVTSDDDMIYPAEWLAELLAAHAAHPNDIVAQRAHVIGTDGDALAEYRTWQPVQTTEPSFAHFATSVSGQLLPPRVQRALRARGRAFLDAAPKADDVWLHTVAVDEGIRTRQVSDSSKNYPFVPATQGTALNVDNVFGGGNDRQLRASHTHETLRRILGDARG